MRSLSLLALAAAFIVLNLSCAYAYHQDRGAERVYGDFGEHTYISPDLSAMIGKTAPEEGKIPFLAFFEDGTNPKTGSLEVDHRYHLISAFAARGGPEEIRSLLLDGNVTEIYLDNDVSATAVRSTASQNPMVDIRDGSKRICAADMVNSSVLWKMGFNGSGVRVAVLDSGIDKNHPDLAGKVVGEANFVEGEDTTDDLLGHGTLCAGIIAGQGIASGGEYRGVAPGADLLNVRVIDSNGNGKVSDILRGIEWAIDNHADVISLSLAGLSLGETNPPITMAADKAASAGAVVCAAAGNRGRNINATDSAQNSQILSFAHQANTSSNSVSLPSVVQTEEIQIQTGEFPAQFDEILAQFEESEAQSVEGQVRSSGIANPSSGKVLSSSAAVQTSGETTLIRWRDDSPTVERTGAAGSHELEQGGMEKIDLLEVRTTQDFEDLRSGNGRSGTRNRNVLLILVPIALAPGLIDSPGDGLNVISVGAVDCNRLIANFSGSGPTRDGRVQPTVVAPGVRVVSTIPPGLRGLKYIDIYYAEESGTSLSTPAAAGAAALLLSAYRNLTPAGFKAAAILGGTILNNSNDEPYEDYYQGAGLIDAYHSYQHVNDGLCAIMPKAWTPGRWSYLPSGKAVYVGMDTGADRPQKKLYGMAPLDKDWVNFIFSTDRERKDLTTSIKGEIAEWITIQPLPNSLPANSQYSFVASLTIPENASGGVYRGSVEISEGGKSIASAPITIEVARDFILSKGAGTVSGSIVAGDWEYYRIKVPYGVLALSGSLKWNGPSELDLFMLSPAGEYYAGWGYGSNSDIEIKDPAGGFWLLAVHGRNLTERQSYNLSLERTALASEPRSWDIGTLWPGDSKAMGFTMANEGRRIDQMSYMGFGENQSSLLASNSVRNEEVWMKSVEIPDSVRKFSVNLTWNKAESHLILLLYDPQKELSGISAIDGTSQMLEQYNPTPGDWIIAVYGGLVPFGLDQSFKVQMTSSVRRPVHWIDVFGPASLDYGEDGELNVSLHLPDDFEGDLGGEYIAVLSDNASLEIPLIASVGGAEITGVGEPKGVDLNADGYYDRLTIPLSLRSFRQGDYAVEGPIVDCLGRMIKWIRTTASIKSEVKAGEVNKTPGMTSSIEMTVDGRDLWRSGACSPMTFGPLFLYDGKGLLLDKADEVAQIPYAGGRFQPPKAFLSGTFSNLTSTSAGLRRISVGVGVNVTVDGSYTVTGTLTDDDGVEIDKDQSSSKLSVGDRSIVLEFNPTKFMMKSLPSRLHLTDVRLLAKDELLDSAKSPWSSDVMSPAKLRGM